jgi:hypothetical protein
LKHLKIYARSYGDAGGLAVGYLDVWRVLEEIVADFRRRGKEIPVEVMDDLKSARTMIRILKADSNREDTVQKIEEYIRTLESYLVSEGQKQFGTEYVDEKLKRLSEARGKASVEKVEETQFVFGVPRGHKWVRARPTAELSLETLKSLAKESGLLHRTQNDGSLLVHGKDEEVRGFVKKMTTEYGLKTEK